MGLTNFWLSAFVRLGASKPRGGCCLRIPRVPNVVIRRLVLYLRTLVDMDIRSDENLFISSQELGERAGVTAAQVRKDLALFGEFGKQGVGYHALSLMRELQAILKVDRDIAVGLVGAGELGMAMTRYNIRRYNQNPDYLFRMAALFDIDPEKIGKDVEGVPIFPVQEMEERVRELNIQIMTIAVPAAVAQEITDMVVRSGVKAILNFAPIKLTVPSDVHLYSADVSLDLQQLAYYL